MKDRMPVHWAETSLAAIAELRLGKMLDKGRQQGEARRYLRNANIRWDSIDTTDVLSMGFADNELERYGISDGDLLICEGGEPGRAAVWMHGPTELMFQKALHRVRLGVGACPRWVMFQLMLDAATGRLAASFTGSTISHLPGEKLAEYPVRLPPAGEQRRAIECLDSYLSRLDAATASLEQVQAKLKAYRASVLKAAVEGRLVPTDAELARNEKRACEPGSVLLERILKERRRRWEDAELTRMTAAGKAPKNDAWKAKYEEPAAPDTRTLPPLPEGWCWASVDQLAADVFYGTSSKTSTEGEVPVLRMGNIVDGRLDLDALKYLPAAHDEFPSLLLSEGDLLFNRTNSAELVGKTAVYRGLPPVASFASYLICARILSEPAWVSHVINSPYGRLWVSDVAVQQVGQANVNGSKLKALPIPLPPSEEQGRLLTHIDALLSNAEQSTVVTGVELRRIARLRQSILKWAFEGKLVDQDPNDEPAEALIARIKAERATATPSKKPRGRKSKTS